MSRFVILLALGASMAVAGCNFVDRRWLSNTGANQVVRVTSGDRLYMNLDEESDGSCRWQATSDDPDVNVTIEHVDGRAKVAIRVHRGYDGPTAVRFRYMRQGVAEPVRTFSITLYRSTGDRAVWE